LQLFSIQLKAARSIRGCYSPRGHSRNLNDFAPSIILVLCDNLARNKRGLRKSAIGPQVSNTKNWQFLNYCPFSAEPIGESALDNAWKVVTDPPNNLRKNMRHHDSPSVIVAARLYLAASTTSSRARIVAS
jgi:hypothetical protein